MTILRAGVTKKMEFFCRDYVTSTVSKKQNIRMEVYREQSIIIGILYVLVFIAGVFSVSNIVDSPDYLTKSAFNSNHINRAAIVQLLMAVFYIAIMILFFPILKNYNKELAIGFLSLRILAVVFTIIGAILLFSILKLSQEYINIPDLDSTRYSMAGSQLRYYRDLTNHVGMIVSLCLGSIVLYVILFQSGLIPPWISIWGIIGALIAISASILIMANQLEIKNTTYLILNIPIALQEIVFAIWLIFKGLKVI
jgi:hypothetical protein